MLLILHVDSLFFWVIGECINSWDLPGSAILHSGCLRTVLMGLKIVNDWKMLYSCVPG